MANAVNLALRKIYWTVPREILEYAFRKEDKRKSLDDCIVDKVLKATVLPDLNSISGKYKEIPLSPDWCIETQVPGSGWQAGIPLIPYAIYKIPPEAREYRNLSQVITMRSPYASVSSIGQVSGTIGSPGFGATAGAAACRVLDSYSGSNMPVLPNPILLAGNCVKLTPMEMSLITQFPWILECRLEYDQDLTNLSPDAVQAFGELMLAATKAYIYNKTVVEMDMGVTMSGHPIGAFKEIITEYRDQYDRYNVLKADFHVGSNYLDQDTMREIFLMGLGGGW